MNANPGDLVVCVVDGLIRTQSSHWAGEGLRRGRIYRVRATGVEPDDALPIYWVTEFPEETLQCRFRKLNDEPENTAIIRKIKQCKPRRVSA